MPVCFGISFTKTPMNQARSLVHVYTDGSVAVSTGAVEMGQGVNTKMAQVAAKMFGLDIGHVRVHTTNTLRIAPARPPPPPPPISTVKQLSLHAKRSVTVCLKSPKIW
ncbi:MAG: molybdopterin cofactor-binding domain-containing protein [Pyrinomonadaceae bacterium]